MSGSRAGPVPVQAGTSAGSAVPPLDVEDDRSHLRGRGPLGELGRDVAGSERDENARDQ